MNFTSWNVFIDDQHHSPGSISVFLIAKCNINSVLSLYHITIYLHVTISITISIYCGDTKSYLSVQGNIYFHDSFLQVKVFICLSQIVLQLNMLYIVWWLFCCRWSSMVSEEHKYGHPELHQLVASTYWKGKRQIYGTYIPQNASLCFLHKVNVLKITNIDLIIIL